jgi:hypothetical protein
MRTVDGLSPTTADTSSSSAAAKALPGVATPKRSGSLKENVVELIVPVVDTTCADSSIGRETRSLIKKPAILSGTTTEYAEQP